MSKNYTIPNTNTRTLTTLTMIELTITHDVSFFLYCKEILYVIRRVTGQNGFGQNGTDKMVRTKWHGQNGSNFYRFQFN